MTFRNLLPTVLVIIGFMVGFGGGSVLRPVTVTETSTQHMTVSHVTTIQTTVTQSTTSLQTIRETVTSRMTVTVVNRVTTTLRNTYTSTVTQLSTLQQVRMLCFSQGQDCASSIAALINNATRYVYVAVYTFTSDFLAGALIEAKNRGVAVKVVIENQQANIQGSEYGRLLSSGIDVRLDGNTALMHHKFVVIDGEIVVTGSYNWSEAAETSNDENIVILHDRNVAKAYESEFFRIFNRGTTHTTTQTTTTRTTTTTANCDPSYPDVCIPPPPPDLDCSDIQYRNFRVLPPDPHRFDRDGDGIGCET